MDRRKGRGPASSSEVVVPSVSPPLSRLRLSIVSSAIILRRWNQRVRNSRVVCSRPSQGVYLGPEGSTVLALAGKGGRYGVIRTKRMVQLLLDRLRWKVEKDDAYCLIVEDQHQESLDKKFTHLTPRAWGVEGVAPGHMTPIHR
jgi:hypothetical protein